MGPVHGTRYEVRGTRYERAKGKGKGEGKWGEKWGEKFEAGPKALSCHPRLPAMRGGGS